MSRVGGNPIALPKGVELKIDGSQVSVKGPKGELSWAFQREITFKQEGDQIIVTRPSDQVRHKAMHGLSRTLLANMVTGVTEGFSKTLEMHGVGYRAQMQGKDLEVSVGYTHPVKVSPPEGIEFEVDGTSKIIVRGANKQVVGQAAADVRKIRPPEPYKGKGIRYEGEYVRRKAGKAGKAME
ncbi:MAG TPA: 50S ribosomal protein L6 [Dehalococcoidia bacterium]